MDNKASHHDHKMKSRHDLHLSRKIWHMSAILFTVGLYQQLNRNQSMITITALLVIILTLDTIRLKNKKLNEYLLHRFSRIIRKDELHHWTAASYLVIGAWIIIYLFPKNISTLSLVLLAIGDPIASIIGVQYGKDKLIGNKSLQGSLAAFVACAIVSLFFYLYNHIMMERIILVSLITGFIGAISELVQIRKIDDNMSFPILSSIMLFFLFHFFGANT